MEEERSDLDVATHRIADAASYGEDQELADVDLSHSQQEAARDETKGRVKPPPPPRRDVPAGSARSDDPMTMTIEGVGSQGTVQLNVFNVIFFISLLMIWIVTWLVHPPFAVVQPLYFIPCFQLYKWWQRNSEVGNFESTILTPYSLGFWPAAWTVWVVELLMIWIVVSLFQAIWFDWGTRDNEEANGEKKDEVCNSCYAVMGFIVSYLIIALVEESAKYMFNRYSRKNNPETANSKKHLMSVVAMSLGFATVDNLLLHAFSLREYEDKRFGAQFGESLAVVILLMFLNTTIQCLTAYYIGMAQAKQQLPDSGPSPTWYDVLGVAILFHGTMVWQAWLLIEFLPFGVALAMIFVIGVCILASLTVVIKRFESRMPHSYLRSVGYLNAFGYGALQLDDDDEEDPPTTHQDFTPVGYEL